MNDVLENHLMTNFISLFSKFCYDDYNVFMSLFSLSLLDLVFVFDGYIYIYFVININFARLFSNVVFKLRYFFVDKKMYEQWKNIWILFVWIDKNKHNLIFCRNISDGMDHLFPCKISSGWFFSLWWMIFFILNLMYLFVLSVFY